MKCETPNRLRWALTEWFASTADRSSAIVGIAAVMAGWCLASPSSAQLGPTTELVNTNSSGEAGDWYASSGQQAMSSDARFVVFISGATNLDVHDINHQPDVFVKDRVTGVTELASIATSGAQIHDVVWSASISDDARFVAFDTTWDGLVPLDHNQVFDVFVRDRLLGITECISVDTLGSPSDGTSNRPTLSSDGRFVCFDSSGSNLIPSDTNSKFDVFVRDRLAGTSTRVSVGSSGNEGNDTSKFAAISGDGRFVVFKSWATNLVPGDTNDEADYFVRDLLLDTTERVNVDSSGNQAWYTPSSSFKEPYIPGISDDGRYVVFYSNASNLVPGDTNGALDVFLRDRKLGITERISVDSYENEVVPPWTSGVNFAQVSNDGRYVMFHFYSLDIAPSGPIPHQHVYVRDRTAGTTALVDVSSDGSPGNDQASLPCMTPDGRFGAFGSDATNLDPISTNGFGGIFVRDLRTGGPEVSVSILLGGQAAILDITGASPNGLIVLGVSLQGQGLLASPWGPLQLDGLSVLLPFVTDITGKVNATVPLHPGLQGLPLWVQGIDLNMNYPTSAWGGKIQ